MYSVRTGIQDWLSWWFLSLTRLNREFTIMASISAVSSDWRLRFHFRQPIIFQSTANSTYRRPFANAFPEMLLILLSLTVALSTVENEGQIFNCNTSDISYLLVKNCTNAVRLNPDRFEYPCGIFKQRTHALRPNLQLATAARKHAADMAAKQYFDHKSKDGRSFADRIRNEGYRGSTIGENLAKGYTSAMNAVSAWMCSDAHRRNLLVPIFLLFALTLVLELSVRWSRNSSELHHRNVLYRSSNIVILKDKSVFCLAVRMLFTRLLWFWGITWGVARG